MSVFCPFCNSKRATLIKKWEYNSTKISRKQCDKCKKTFNFYKSKKSEWTIPKNSKTIDIK